MSDMMASQLRKVAPGGRSRSLLWYRRAVSTSYAVPAALARELAAIAGGEGGGDAPAARAVYECDGFTLERAVPDVVVLPRSTDEVARLLRAAWRAGVPFVPRGAGTGLSGG